MLNSVNVHVYITGIYCDVPGSPCLSKNKVNQVCDSCFLKSLSRLLPNLLIFKGLLVMGPSVDGPKDPWPCVWSVLGRFVGDPTSLARDNMSLFGPRSVNSLNGRS